MQVQMTRPVTEEVDLDIRGISLLTKEQAESLPHWIVNDTYKGGPNDPGIWWLKGEKATEENKFGTLRFYLADAYKRADAPNVYENSHDVTAANVPNDIRPVLTVGNLTDLELSVGDTVSLGGVEWTVASETLLLCNEDINDYTYPEHGVPYSSCTEDCTMLEHIADYEYSTVKQYIDEWALERGLICPDRSKDLKVYDISILTEDEARDMPIVMLRSPSRTFYWLQMAEQPKKYTQSYCINAGYTRGFDVPITGSSTEISGCGIYNNNFVAVRPVIECQGDNLNVRDEFTYKGLSFVVTPIKRNGHPLAITKDIICENNGRPVYMPFRDCIVDLDKETATDKNGQPLDRNTTNAYEFSDVKKFLDSWARKNELINAKDEMAKDADPEL